jgi:diguanylate cyclase (GGDEF)-like protein
MAQCLSVDIRTVLLLLSLGNMAAACLLLVYGGRLRNTPEGLFTWAKLLLGPAWMLLVLRGRIPDPLSFGLGNGLLIFGFWLEAASIKALDRPETPPSSRRLHPWKAMLVAVSLGLLTGELVPQPNLRVALASAAATGCFALASSRLLFGQPRPSPLRRALGIGYALLCLTTLWRMQAALSDGAFTLFNAPAEQGITFSLLYTLMFGGSFGLLLVLKERADQTLLRTATQDELTGAPNRRALLERARLLAAKARREGTPLAALMLDIDHFKQVNDTHGHNTGDAVLRDLARIIREGLRTYDAFGRFGGEEFVAVLPGLGLDDARRAAERIRTAAEASQPLPDPAVRYTVSIGVALGAPGDSDTDGGLLGLLHRADQAMYKAKRLGRNRVEVAD